MASSKAFRAVWGGGSSPLCLNLTAPLKEAPPASVWRGGLFQHSPTTTHCITWLYSNSWYEFYTITNAHTTQCTVLPPPPPPPHTHTTTTTFNSHRYYLTLHKYTYTQRDTQKDTLGEASQLAGLGSDPSRAPALTGTREGIETKDGHNKMKYLPPR